MKLKKIVELFRSVLIISTFTLGGGLAMIAMMQRRFVDELHWMDENEMLDITAIAQAVPGSNFTNAAVMVGYRIAGIPGSVAAITAAITPPIVIISIISLVYTQFRENKIIAICLQVMRAGVAAYILDVLIGMVKKLIKSRRTLYILMMIIAFVARQFLGVSITALFLSCFAVGIVDMLYHRRREEKAE